MDYKIAIAGNAELEGKELLQVVLTILIRTPILVSKLGSVESGEDSITFYLSMQPQYKELNKVLINTFNEHGLRWAYFKNSFFHTSKRERNTTRKGIMILTSPMTSIKDMTMIDFFNNGSGKDISIKREIIQMEDLLTTATKYVRLKESYELEEMILVETNKLKTIF